MVTLLIQRDSRDTGTDEQAAHLPIMRCLSCPVLSTPESRNLVTWFAANESLSWNMYFYTEATTKGNCLIRDLSLYLWEWWLKETVTKSSHSRVSANSEEIFNWRSSIYKNYIFNFTKIPIFQTIFTKGRTPGRMFVSFLEIRINMLIHLTHKQVSSGERSDLCHHSARYQWGRPVQILYKLMVRPDLENRV